jgi:hypothetical protein
MHFDFFFLVAPRGLIVSLRLSSGDWHMLRTGTTQQVSDNRAHGSIYRSLICLAIFMNDSCTLVAVFADVSINSMPISSANFCASSVGTARF